MEPLGQMRRAIQPLLFARVGDKDDGSIQSTRKILREHSRQLDNRRRARAIVIGTRSILGCLESRQRSEVGASADAGVIVPAHHHHARSVASGQPGDDVHDVHHRPLRMSAHLHHRRVVFDLQAAAASFAVTRELVEQVSPGRADASTIAQRVAHRVASAE